jgi:hypothetical protein
MNAPRILISSLALSCLSTAQAMSQPPTPPPGLNVKEDGGAAVYTESSSGAPGELVSAEQAREFPIAQRNSIYVLGGGVRGFGVLGRFETPGPRQILIARSTTVSEKEPYRPIALASVFDPEGNIAAVEDLTNQSTGTETRVITIPEGKAGTWRVSFAGGRKGDTVEIRLPQTENWGVRGEMALGVTATTLRTAYLWVPPTAEKVLLGIESGSAEGITLTDATGKTVLAEREADTAGRVGRLVLNNPPQGKVVRINLPATFDGAIVVEGAPGLLCPTEASALALRGGTVESEGLLLAGPLQARARAWMVAQKPTLNLSPDFNFPAEIPEGMKDLGVQVLAFQKYGPLNNLRSMIERQNQNLDPSSPYFGSDFEPKPGDTVTGWTNFQPGKLAGVFQASSLAAATAFDSPLNPAFKNEDLAKRAAFAAFYHFTWLQGDDLLRENNLFTTRYPMTHSFFVYANLAQGYRSLKGLLAEDADAIWKQGVMALGDKLADYQAYESNQWAHMMRGHLDVYLATGEKRFLQFFESEMTSYVDNTFGPQSKFGQHPAGYYLEEFGPDGNYDKLNSFAVVSMYYDYREIQEADQKLVEKLRASVDKNLRFTSFFWLPQPDGEIISPNALNCRTTAGLGGAGYPGQFTPKSEFPLSAARFSLTKAPATGAGSAGTFSFLANDEAWIRKTLEDGLKKKEDGYKGSGGDWLPSLVHAYSQPQKVEPSLIPVQETDKTWQLPGLLAFNRGGIYGVVFYDVVGADHVIKGITGGGPTALWTPGTGSFLASMHAAKPPDSLTITVPNALTFACVYGKDGKGNFYYSGKERAEIKTEGEEFTITSKLTRPFATLAWIYQPNEKGLQLSVQLKSLQKTQEAYVNLPLVKRLPGTTIELTKPNRVTLRTPGGGVDIEWPSQYGGQLLASALPDIQRLVIPLPSDGTPLPLTIRPVSTTTAQVP